MYVQLYRIFNSNRYHLCVINNHFVFSFPDHYQREMLHLTFATQQLIQWCSETSVPQNTLQDLRIGQLVLQGCIFQHLTQLQLVEQEVI